MVAALALQFSKRYIPPALIVRSISTSNTFSVDESCLRAQGGMQIFAETLTGRTITLEVNESGKIKKFEAEVHDKEGTPPRRQPFHFTEKHLDVGRAVADCSIQQGSSLQSALPLRDAMAGRGSKGGHPRAQQSRRATFSALNRQILDENRFLRQQILFYQQDWQLQQRMQYQLQQRMQYQLQQQQLHRLELERERNESRYWRNLYLGSFNIQPPALEQCAAVKPANLERVERGSTFDPSGQNQYPPNY